MDRAETAAAIAFIDETGDVQPTKNVLRKVRGVNSIYHNNGIHTWPAKVDGEVENVEVLERSCGMKELPEGGVSKGGGKREAPGHPSTRALRALLRMRFGGTGCGRCWRFSQTFYVRRSRHRRRAQARIGRTATPAEIAGWDIDVRPDGQGLPPGSGVVKAGEAVYMENRAACHGEFGESAGRWPQVAAGRVRSKATIR